MTLPFVTHSIQEAILLGHGVVVLGRSPSRVEEIVDVSAVDDPDTEEFVRVSRHLGALSRTRSRGLSQSTVARAFGR